MADDMYKACEIARLMPCFHSSDELRKAWDNSKSVATNLADMGLVADPNKTFPISANPVSITVYTLGYYVMVATFPLRICPTQENPKNSPQLYEIRK